MSKLSFIHLSDIHFNNLSETLGDVDKDLREAIVEDLRLNALKKLTNIKGILITGDIAFSGSEAEYNTAKIFLEGLTEILRINKTDIYCVPGNHDVDQSLAHKKSIIYSLQKNIDEAETLDIADNIFTNYINDRSGGNLLFDTISNYNAFARSFDCEAQNWHHTFELSEHMSLKIYGLNSAIISNADDRKFGEGRKMYIGHAQIPTIKDCDNVINMSLCHHPPSLWKFSEQLISKMNKRVDIQLYGHMHEQSAIFNENEVILFSGATHPVRTGKWDSQYNWISIECDLENEKQVEIEIHPRILSEDKHSFVTDKKIVPENQSSIKQTIHIGKKREINNRDNLLFQNTIQEHANSDNSQLHTINDNENINVRELKYRFFELSYLKQLSILLELKLLEETDRNKSFSNNINKILNKAMNENKLDILWKKITN